MVGSGPNGLAAAIALAAAGIEVTVLEACEEIGGGTRSGRTALPGLLVDHCSAVHPMAAGSPFLTRLGLDRYGLEWRWPEIDAAHPLPNGDGADLHRSVDRTAAALGPDGPRWRAAFGSPSEGYDDLAEDVMGPLLRPPRHPLRTARFGLPALLPATAYARLFTTSRARALFMGVAAHAVQPLDEPLSSAVGLGLLTAGHRHGWPVVAGGSRRLTDAMAAMLRDLGGMIETGVGVRTAARLPPADLTMFDLAPEAVADILGDRLPTRVARDYRRFRRGPGVFKVDFAVEGGVPWAHSGARRAGTVHVGGDAREIAEAERRVASGRMPRRPFVLVGQQYLADPERSAGGVHPVYSYAHVPHGYDGDATELVTAQIERYAPGFRERVTGTAVTSPGDLAASNANLVGGDVTAGAMGVSRLLFGPRPTLAPYDTGVPGVYLCSAATPPGPGAHGMCGANAARAALRWLERRA